MTPETIQVLSQTALIIVAIIAIGFTLIGIWRFIEIVRNGIFETKMRPFRLAKDELSKAHINKELNNKSHVDTADDGKPDKTKKGITV